MASLRVTLAFLFSISQVTLITGSLLRKNVDHLSETEILALQTHLRQLEDDDTATGFQQLVASYHGEPSACEDKDHNPRACCVHGMPTFVMWHRLFVVQFERALVLHGLAKIGVPYWDWTEPLHDLPELVKTQIFRASNGEIGKRNAWFSGDINYGDVHKRTARAIDERLFEDVPPGGKSHLFDLVLDALEEEDFCHFATQFEVAHNHIHYLVGGRNKYSMSTLEYSSYDPIFFMHHSNVDRIFVIWQELQKLRGKPYDHADCSVELFREHMHPFDRDNNTIQITHTFNQPKDLFSHLQLGYTYEDLTLGGMNIDQLHHLLEQRHARERAFAIFSLHGLGISANVKVEVCENIDDDHEGGHHEEDHEEGSHHCEFAGDFFVLGGANEMPWEFVYPFHFDVTEAVHHLGLPLDGPYHVMVDVVAVNGTSLGHDLLPKPYGMHRTGAGYHDPEIHDGKTKHTVVRKDIDVLTDEEVYHLRQAMARFMNDSSVDGFQAVAEFHGLPAKCPHPDAAVRYACCVHGMATFPHWHRLFVVEVEDELKSRGLGIGIPYWDWTKPRTTIPALAANLTYVDPHNDDVVHNPFHDARIDFLNEVTHREPMEELTEDPKFGDHTALFDGMLLAFEQTDFCDFEIQFEVIHNAPHVLVGGFASFSLTTLHYSAFDPIFYLHHSNVDRLWAIWQKLQILRGLPYKAHCASTMTQESMKPFGFPPPWNNDEKTFDNARPTNIYDYEHVLDYTYDTLQFGGMTVKQLHDYLEEKKTRDRTFVGIHLHNIGISAWVDLTLSVEGGDPYHVGHVAVLGGEKEMPWHFDRLFKVEITEALHTMGLHCDDDFEVHLDIEDIHHHHWPEDTFSHTTILHHPAQMGSSGTHGTVKEYTRSDVNSLTREQVQNFRDAMQHLQDDTTIHGYYQIAAFHGQPKWCPSPDAEKKYACCAHGMSIFPHWHRLLTVQAENALHENGFHDGLPYWDWTLPMTHLPDIVLGDMYEHPKTHEMVHNPLHDFTVDGHTTERHLREDKLFQQPEFGHLTDMAEHVMLAFEQDDYCDFEIQYEIAHNYIHALVGGNEEYSMASLRYTAFDPLFYLHHSMTDRIWAIWQELQHYRGKPYNSANCAIESLRKPLQPFAQTSVVNPDAETRDHAVPFEVFNYEKSFHYHYDNFQFYGMSIPQLKRKIVKRQAMERSFAGFMLHGVGQSVLVVFDVCDDHHTCEHAGEFYLLGDEYETPWNYDRLYKYEITHHLEKRHIDHHDRYEVEYEVFCLDGSSLGHDLFGNSTIVYNAGHKEGTHYRQDLTVSSHVRRNLADLSEGESESLRAALLDMEEDGSFEQIARFHGYPGLCQHDGHPAACCIHGSPTFPHWHRLYVEQVENALLNHGSAVSVPYWDWTQPIREIPHLLADATYFNSRTQSKEPNPFFRWKISTQNEYTSRDPQDELFNSHYLLDQVLLALEQTTFCDFEIQFEIMHNTIHSWVGGRGKYSMSGLDYSSFDPIFFLHHANVDRIWAIWQALQSHRHLQFEESDCALNLMRKPMHPFDDKTQNLFDVTVHYSRPVDVFDYSGNLDYQYDNLKLNDWSIPQLEEVLKKQRSRDRMFAGFLLHNVGTSADVQIYICVSTGGHRRNCKHPAGTFSVLGGEYEMPFAFDRLYKYDISDPVRKLGLRLDSAAEFDLRIKIKAVNGSYLPSNLLSKPTIIFQPGEGHHQDEHGHSERHLVRKEANNLSPAERRSLVRAMRSLQEDHSADGFQSLAAFHALPPLCPNPGASERFACCVHGMATFPQWHRLYTVQFEDALRRHGALVGVPYLDSVHAIDELPHLITDEVWHDPLFDIDIPNPWHGAHIDFEGEDAHVERDIQHDKLALKGPHGYDTWSWKQYIYALEQEDYCDFEVQFEVAHNAIHAWLGGHKIHSMAHLHYASYDPVFILHHSNTDRIFAIWQKLQKHRGHDPNEINCALELMREPLKPFSFGAPYNLNPITTKYSKPEDGFDYTAHFNYEYDKLELQGMDVARLQNYIDEQKEHDRVFAGFLLHGIGISAHVDFSVCDENDECHAAGDFDVLGGSAEMPWRFDRLYKYEITDVLKEHHMDVHDPFHIDVHIVDINGNELNATAFPEPSVIFDPKSGKTHLHEVGPNHIRHELSTLTKRDIMSLKSAMLDLQHDKTKNGYQSMARFHGAPAMCPTPDAAIHACCVHGMPTFPHWHRLYTVEMEDALARHGSSVGLPYWDWTLPIDHLPELFTTETYYDVWRDEVMDNPFARGYVESAHGYTMRDPQPELTKMSPDGEHSVLFDEVLLTLEQTDFCDFEVQFEVLHNAIHYLVGGRKSFSLASLEYSSYDPLFFVHHAMVDKIWVVWQEIQKHRGLPHDRADCAVNFMNENLHPFDWDAFNQDVRTRAHSLPTTVFEYEDLGYHYDDMKLGGKTLEELEELIHEHQSHHRVFAGFSLHGIRTSADVVFSVCTQDHHCYRAGGIFVLGGPLEMPWSFDRLFKYDITEALHEAHISPDDVFNHQAPFTIEVEIHAINGTALPPSTIPPPTIMFIPAHGASEDHSTYTVAGVGVRKDINTLTADERHSLRDALQHVMDGSGPISYQNLSAWHGWPGLCQHEGHKVACCHHGMSSFPQWHRLYVRALEELLTMQGAVVGIPYWDWTEAFTDLPTLVTEEEHNPFHHGMVEALHKKTTRSPRPQLFNDPEHGDESFFYRQIMLAFEQRDYCDFEVQFEVAHNAIHSWTGGSSPYGMSTLEFTAYDPLFFIHHSNVDRQFAIWQALQKYRRLDYNTANCNIQQLRKPMHPFDWKENPLHVIRQHSRAVDVFNYNEFGYQYDNLNFHGHTIPELEALLEKKRQEDHVYANFLLHNIGTSADVSFDLCDDDDHCNFAGTFAVLGGPLEMPFHLDRLFSYDVTSVFRQMHLRPDSNYHFDIHLTAVNGTELDCHLLDPPSISFVPGKRHDHGHDHDDDVPVPTKSDDVVRYEISHLTMGQVSDLRDALYKLQNDHGPNGYEKIASFHGAPGLCPEQGGSERIACCQHGMAAFPHWHRLLTVQFERALKHHGAHEGVPYWDWTRPTTSLPYLFTDSSENNPFKTFHIGFEDHDIVRDVQDDLFRHPSEGDLESLFHQTLETLEETNYCDFEVQLEILHNAVHALVGGHETYGMATLAWSAFDPFFMVHHASIDRIWKIWQTMQKLRHKPFSFASCAGRQLDKPLEPFNYESVNKDPVTRANYMPSQVFDAEKFHYHYDNLDLNGHSVSELLEMVDEMRAHDRMFAGFILHGFQKSAQVHVDLEGPHGEMISAGNFYVLGGPKEMPWAYERPYKLDITDAWHKAGLHYGDTVKLSTRVTCYDGTPLNVTIRSSILIERHAHADHDVLVLQVGRGMGSGGYKVKVKRGTHIKIHLVDGAGGTVYKELESYTSWKLCAIPIGMANSYEYGKEYELPSGDYFFSNNDKDNCLHDRKTMITIDSE